MPAEPTKKVAHTDAQVRALKLMSSRGSRFVSPGYLGSEVYAGGGNRRVYARPGAALLYAMRDLGLVQRGELAGFPMWELTEKGEAEAASHRIDHSRERKAR